MNKGQLPLRAESCMGAFPGSLLALAFVIVIVVVIVIVIGFVFVSFSPLLVSLSPSLLVFLSAFSGCIARTPRLCSKR